MNITKVCELEAVERFEHEYNGVELWFEAKKASLTPRFIDQINTTSTVPKALAEMLTAWSVTRSDDPADVWPLTEDELSRLPAPFLNSIVNKMAESWAGDKKKQKASATG